MNVKSLYPILVTENMEETKKFYCDTLGFAVQHDAVRLDGGHVVVLSNPLGLEIEVMDPPKNGPVKLSSGILGFRMNVEDVEKAFAEMKVKGYTVVSEPKDTPTSRSMIVRGPDGVSITIMQHKHH